MKVRFFLAFLLLCGITAPAPGQLVEAWVDRYNGPGNGADLPTGITADKAGNIYVTGISTSAAGDLDYATVKYDPNGVRLWVRRYDPAGRVDTGSAVAVDSQGNVYVTGGSDLGTGAARDITTIKYDPSGNVLWIDRYNGTGNALDYGQGIAIDSAGFVYVLGGSEGSGTALDSVTIKYSPGGIRLRVHRYDGTGHGNDFPTHITLDHNDNLYLSYMSWNPANNGDFVVEKYAPNGVLAWELRYDGAGSSHDEVHETGVNQLGEVYITGPSYGAGTGQDFVTLKRTEAGAHIWERRYNGPANDTDHAQALWVVPEGVYMTGYSFRGPDNYELVTIKYDLDGNVVWMDQVDTVVTFADMTANVEVDPSGMVCITGGIEKNSPFRADLITIVYGPEGTVLGTAQYNGPGNDRDDFPESTVAGIGAFAVTARSIGVGIGLDYVTIKYIAPIMMFPSQATVFRGVLVSGSLADLVRSDDERMVLRPGVVLSQAEAPVQLILEGTSLREETSELRFKLEAHASIANIRQAISLFEFSANRWVELDSRLAATTDSVAEVAVTTDPGRFIETGGRVRARISYKEAGPVFSYPWFARIDQAVWTVAP